MAVPRRCVVATMWRRRRALVLALALALGLAGRAPTAVGIATGVEHTPWERRRVAVHVTRGCEQRLRRLADERAPFTGAAVYQEEVLRVSYSAEPGTVAAIFGPGDSAKAGRRNAAATAVGLYDPLSPVRVRLVEHGATAAPLDGEWVRRAIGRAAAERHAAFCAPHTAPLAAAERTTGFRIVNGENDGLPGLVIDRYGGTFVLKLYAGAWLPWVSAAVRALEHACAPDLERTVLLLSRELAQLPAAARLGLTHGDVLSGLPLPASGEVAFEENGLSFGCEPVVGQKTGFFLDQRDNRALVRALATRAPGARVLNVFSYTGGFSLYAADGGASHVTSIDASRAAIDAVERNWARNAHRPAVAAATHVGIAADAFEAMDGLWREKREFELVVVDPPSFAQRERHVDAALAAYAKLARAAVMLAAPGGLVLLASCSAKVAPDAFHAAVEAAARQAGRPLEVEARLGHACDHPVRAAGATPYLKATLARVR